MTLHSLKKKLSKMHPFFLKFIEKHTPPMISLLICIGAATWYIGDTVKIGFQDMKVELIDDSRKPFYLSLEYSLAKQEAKLAKDPNDLKEADIELLSIMCNSDFGERYIPTLPANRRLDASATCRKLTELYTARFH